MKKTLIIVLLIALVLGAFTACNGDVYEDLVEDNSITLVLKNGNIDGWSFENGTTSQKIQIPAGCETWGDLVGRVSVTIIKTGEDDVTMPLSANNENPDSPVVFKKVVDNYLYAGQIDSASVPKTSYSQVKNETAINVGEVYNVYLYKYSPS